MAKLDVRNAFQSETAINGDLGDRAEVHAGASAIIYAIRLLNER